MKWTPFVSRVNAKRLGGKQIWYYGGGFTTGWLRVPGCMHEWKRLFTTQNLPFLSVNSNRGPLYVFGFLKKSKPFKNKINGKVNVGNIYFKISPKGYIGYTIFAINQYFRWVCFYSNTISRLFYLFEAIFIIFIQLTYNGSHKYPNGNIDLFLLYIYRDVDPMQVPRTGAGLKQNLFGQDKLRQSTKWAFILMQSLHPQSSR